MKQHHTPFFNTIASSALALSLFITATCYAQVSTRTLSPENVAMLTQPTTSAKSATLNAPKVADLKAFAATFSAADVDVSGAKIIYKTVPADVNVKILGSTYEQILNYDGTIIHPLNDKITVVTFEFSRGNEKAQTKPIEITIPADADAKIIAGANTKPVVIPAVQEWNGKTGTTAIRAIYLAVPKKQRAEYGARMKIFVQDYKEMTGITLPLKSVSEIPADKKNALIVTANPVRRNLGNEGYELVFEKDATFLNADDSLGAFWATRTLLQMTKQAKTKGEFPCGVMVDYPQYKVRGMLYDAGRKNVPMPQLIQIMKNMAYYKLNDFHVCLNNNFIWLHEYANVAKNASPEEKQKAYQKIMDANPTGFHIESKMVGPKNGLPLTCDECVYSKKDFGKFIDISKLYGVNIVPEIDVPGHAMSFVRVRPDLMYRGKVHKPHDVERVAMLDASTDPYPGKPGKTYRDETLSFIQSVFDEYLVPEKGKKPVFRNSVVHIGTDEYYGNAEDYRAFADSMLKYVLSRGFTPRFWGSLTMKKGKTPVISKGVQMCVWSRDWNLPQPAIDDGFDIINILDRNGYVVPNGRGNMGAYQDKFDQNFMYGPNWQPHIMVQYKVVPGHPQLLGSMWAVWFDNNFRRDPGLIDYDIFEQVFEVNAVVAEKLWNTGTDVDFETFKQRRATIDLAPGINPRHAVDFDTLTFSNEKLSAKNATFKNGTFTLNGGNSFVKTAHEGIAPDYDVEFTLTRKNATATEQVVFSSWTGAFKAVQKDSTKVGITRDYIDYVFDYELPVNKAVKMKLVSRGRSLTLFADGKRIGTPIRLREPNNIPYHSFIFPLTRVGATENTFTGTVSDFKLTKIKPRDLSDVIPVADLEKPIASSEHAVGEDGDISKAFDRNPKTYWHSKYNPKDNPPFTVEVALKSPTKINGISFLPRSGQNNGTPQKADFYIKNASGQWGKVASYQGGGNERHLQSVSFDAVSATAVKMVITQGVGGFGTLAELYIHKAK